ncbi:MAG: tRNA pseudouridine(38-40) synthase TruA [Thiohalorhabdus sp.]|uniref:tRNA pseudouridine(38-40) synthase TruA n=1 Tax=Thiohalorhabdus sp. TaxID=3094134 RepID=UPI003980EE4A
MPQRIALLLEFDGARFHGWQRQANAVGVQEALESALYRVADGPVRTVAAGRTDSGVHGLGMVAHFDPPVERPTHAWVQGANAHLPPGAAVVEAVPVAAGFDARRTARARTYLYRLLARPARPGLEHGRVTWVRGPLDVEAMAAGARHLEGRRDFSAFRASGCQAAQPVREVQRIAVRALDEEVQVAVRADAFLYNMVRIMVGSLAEVGRGRRDPAWIGEVLAGGSRDRAGPTARPEGLYFAAVHYPPGWGAPSPPVHGPGGFDPRNF